MRTLINIITLLAVLAFGFLIPSSAIAGEGRLENASVDTSSSRDFINQSLIEFKEAYGERIDKNGNPILTKIRLKRGFFGIIPFARLAKDRYSDPPFVIKAVKTFADMYNREVDKFAIKRYPDEPRIIYAVNVSFCPRRGCR